MNLRSKERGGSMFGWLKWGDSGINYERDWELWDFKPQDDLTVMELWTALRVLEPFCRYPHSMTVKKDGSTWVGFEHMKRHYQQSEVKEWWK